MRIERVRLFSYTLPLVRPITMLGDAMSAREGFVVALTDDSGETGWGEMAGIPGRSTDHDLIFLRFEFADAAAKMVKVQIHDGRSLEDLLGTTIPWRVKPSALMGLESALLTLVARRKNLPFAELISRKHSDHVAINSLIETQDRFGERVTEIIDEGARAVKLKVGRQSVEDDIDLVHHVRRAFPPFVRLRLDANRRWSMDEAVAFASGIEGVDIEYIEEPLINHTQLEELHMKAPHLPLAIDETVRAMSPDDVRSAAYLKAVVLKPSMIGGIRMTVAFVRACRESGKTPVISSSIESSIGLSVLAHLSAALTPGTPSGLDTARLFSRDLLSPGFPIGRSRVALDELYPAVGVIDMSLLKEIPLE
ncbi:MAG: o-succinylbenzoate synthase [candidate division Zixibacteria bacterium]|nr:o-succinylbenzoate synthase [candidate division Zixibacteria bacterium]